MDDIWIEVDALRSIFEDELSIEEKGSQVVVEKKVRPNDQGGVSSASIVLQFTLQQGYPMTSSAVVHLSNPRGIADSSYSELRKEVDERLNESEGMPIMFDIIQLCSDFLLSHQHSASLACPICLSALAASAVTCTPCDHYTHTQCLSEHTSFAQRQLGEKLESMPPHLRPEVDRSLTCPVCREVIEDEIEPIYPSPVRKGKGRRTTHGENGRRSQTTHRENAKGAEPDKENKEEELFEFDWTSWRKQQSALRKMFEKQRIQGGIIDLEEERKKNLVTEDTVVILPSSSVDPDDLPVDDSSPVGGVSLAPPPGFPRSQEGGVAPPPGFPRSDRPPNNTEQRHRGRGHRGPRRPRGRGGAGNNQAPPTSGVDNQALPTSRNNNQTPPRNMPSGNNDRNGPETNPESGRGRGNSSRGPRRGRTYFGPGPKSRGPSHVKESTVASSTS